MNGRTRVVAAGLSLFKGVREQVGIRRRGLVSVSLILAASLTTAFAQDSELYGDVTTAATGYSTSLRTNGVLIMSGVVAALFAIAYVRKILAAK